MDSSASYILLPKFKSQASTLLSIYIDLCHVEKTKMNKKEAVIGPLFKKEFAYQLLRKGDLKFSLNVAKVREGIIVNLL